MEKALVSPFEQFLHGDKTGAKAKTIDVTLICSSYSFKLRQILALNKHKQQISYSFCAFTVSGIKRIF